MNVIEIPLNELRKRIEAGEELTLAENFMHNGNILIGKERVLTERELDRMDGKVYDNLKVTPHREKLTGEKVINGVIAICSKVLKESKDYQGLHSDIKFRIEQTFKNQLPHHDYICLRAAQIKKNAPRILKRTIHTAINALIMDINLQQINQPNGMQNSLRFEKVLTGALLRNLGFMKTSRKTVETTVGELRDSDDPHYLKVPELTRKILHDDREKSGLSDEQINAAVQSWERLDGSGLPDGLSGDEIMPEALTVAFGAELYLYLSGELSKNKRTWTEIKRRFRSLKGDFGEQRCKVMATAFKHLEKTRD